MNTLREFLDKICVLEGAQTRAYVINVFAKPVDLSGKSVTILFAEANFSHQFQLYQNLADWLLFGKTMFPKYFNNASDDYYNSVAQTCYYRCYKIIREWQIFEELAEKFPEIIINLRRGWDRAEEQILPIDRSLD